MLGLQRLGSLEKPASSQCHTEATCTGSGISIWAAVCVVLGQIGWDLLLLPKTLPLPLAMGKERASACAKGVSLVGTGGEAQNLECLESHAYQRRTSHLDI